jgi:transposase
VYRTASVVGIDTLFQVSRESDVFLFRKYFATDEVYVKHFTFLNWPSFAKASEGSLALGSGPINFLFSIFADDDAPVQGGHHVSDPFWLTPTQLNRIKPHFPLSHGIPRVDDLRVVSGIMHVIRNGLRWRDAPKDYGPHKTLYNRFVRWSRLGVFDRIFASLASERGAPEQLMIDATHLKAHRTAASLLKKGMFPAVSDARKAA